ncbi:hypothetical protein LUX57_46125 [Actinomadura madurae]|uniref:hypothetical protein n=1 Tax=Actinomadura madurae TaxID=1993 RepID=UPI0020D216D3|nr:hypothetical protein [Actinomadura madurae]MCP9971582.1 hypothetical protein [Actinomadura madurae]
MITRARGEAPGPVLALLPGIGLAEVLLVRPRHVVALGDVVEPGDDLGPDGVLVALGGAARLLVRQPGAAPPGSARPVSVRSAGSGRPVSGRPVSVRSVSGRSVSGRSASAPRADASRSRARWTRRMPSAAGFMSTSTYSRSRTSPATGSAAGSASSGRPDGDAA